MKILFAFLFYSLSMHTMAQTEQISDKRKIELILQSFMECIDPKIKKKCTHSFTMTL